MTIAVGLAYLVAIFLVTVVGVGLGAAITVAALLWIEGDE